MPVGSRWVVGSSVPKRSLSKKNLIMPTDMDWNMITARGDERAVARQNRGVDNARRLHRGYQSRLAAPGHRRYRNAPQRHLALRPRPGGKSMRFTLIDRRLRRRLQSSALSREHRQPHPRRRLLPAASDHPHRARKIKRQAIAHRRLQHQLHAA
jgi:hypothetical protein